MKYFAQGTTVTIQGNARVIGATAAAPIVIQTAAPHGLTTGDIVQNAGIAGNTAANGQWVVVLIDSTHFSLNNSVGNSAYVSGGFCTHIGHATQGVLVDNTVFPVLPSYALQARIESLSWGTAVRVFFTDAVDANFVTEESLIGSELIGTLGQRPIPGAPANNDYMYSARDNEVPGTRLGQPNAYMRMKLFFTDDIPSQAVTFSGWISD